MRRVLAAALSAAALEACCISIVAPTRPVADRCPVGVSPDPPPPGTRILAVQRVACGAAATKDCLARLQRSACEAGGTALYSVHPEGSGQGTLLVAAVGAAPRG